MAYGMHASRGGVEAETRPSPRISHHPAVLGAVREDVRQTLRCGWIDPAIDTAAASPVFFTAAWSAIRPNVGKSFLLLARSIRTEAADSISRVVTVPDMRKRLDRTLDEEELRRVEDAARASHHVTAKVQLVVHALLRAARRERIPGTGREEPPVRRGVPEWQRWMSFQPAPEDSWAVLEEAMEALALPAVPATLRLLARWPAVLDDLWQELGRVVSAEAWRGWSMRLRRTVLAGIESLPHPVELQWMALRERGFSEEERSRVAEVLAAHDAVMAHHSLVAAFAWLAFGAPDVGLEG